MTAGERSIGRRTRALTLALVAALLLGLSAPTAAFQILRDQGARGDFTFKDTSARPGGTCGYGPQNSAHESNLRWIRVKAPRVYAADRTGARDHRKVSWRFYAQRKQPSGPWTTFAKSALQKAMAYDDAVAPFHATKVTFPGKHDDSDVRALVIIEWFRPDGSVEARVKLTPNFYSVDWTVGDPAFVFEDSCGSWAD